MAVAIGEAQAAKLARAFLVDTWALASSLPWASAVVATTAHGRNELRLPGGQPRIWLQGGGNLGQRLERILRRGLAEASFAIAIGGDTPGLPPRLLHEAAQALAAADAVLGPADDGGFYLLALRRCPLGLLQRLPWSESATFAATRERLEERGLSVHVLDPWFDVDRPEDVVRLEKAIADGTLHAPATTRLLRAFRERGVRCGSR